jgi:class 3 adenylate cyclase
MKYGVLGDGVNLASRLEELNKRYVTKVLISDCTFSEPGVEEKFVTRPLDMVVVKGKKLPTKVRALSYLARSHIPCALTRAHTHANSHIPPYLHHHRYTR